MEAWEMREWFATYLDALNRHDLDEVRTFLAPDVRRAHLPGGADAWVDDLSDLLRGFPDWQWRRIQVIVEDDRLAVHLRANGTHTGAFAHVGATRRRVNLAQFSFFRIAAGRIVEASGTDDAAAIRSQLS